MCCPKAFVSLAHSLGVGRGHTLIPQPGVSFMSCLANSHSSSKTGLRYHLLQKAFLIATRHIGLMCEPTAPCNPSLSLPVSHCMVATGQLHTWTHPKVSRHRVIDAAVNKITQFLALCNGRSSGCKSENGCKVGGSWKIQPHPDGISAGG